MTPSPSLYLKSFDDARTVLIDGGLACIEGVNTAWLLLKDVIVTELPKPLQPDWTAVSRRANTLAELGSGSLGESSVEEAGDIGSIFLFLRWLLRPEFGALLCFNLTEPLSDPASLALGTQ